MYNAKIHKLFQYTFMNLNWYNTLNKAPLTPPSEYFMPVWCIIYALIIISLIIYLATKTKKNKNVGIIIFLIQIILNLSWIPTFFIFENAGLSLIIILVLNIIIAIQIILFYKISKVSAYLLIPYIFWITFASYLNTYIYLFNK